MGIVLVEEAAVGVVREKRRKRREGRIFADLAENRSTNHKRLNLTTPSLRSEGEGTDYYSHTETTIDRKSARRKRVYGREEGEQPRERRREENPTCPRSLLRRRIEQAPALLRLSWLRTESSTDRRLSAERAIRDGVGGVGEAGFVD
jgi:hypothetical protein